MGAAFASSAAPASRPSPSTTLPLPCSCSCCSRRSIVLVGLAEGETGVLGSEGGSLDVNPRPLSGAVTVLLLADGSLMLLSL